MKENTRIRLIIFTLMLCVLASLGFARFSFGAVLPFMKEGLQLDYRQTGLVASGIFLGYLISSFLSGYFVIRFTAKKVIISSLILAALSMGIIATANGFWQAMVGSLFLGVGSGGANIPALGVVSRWFAPNRRGMAMGMVNSGNGFGILFSGLAVPLIITLQPEAGWRYSWILLAVLILGIMIFNSFSLKNDPKDVGMKPVGTSIAIPDSNKKADVSPVESNTVYKNKNVWFVGLTYMAWGFSYLIFSTFLVDYLMTDVGFEKTQAGHYFAIAGFVSVFSGFLWGGISDKLGRIPTLAIVYALQAALLIAMVITSHPIVILLEVIIYGLSLWATPTITNASISEFVQPTLVPIAMGFLTLFFGVGQFISPIITGALIDQTNSYYLAFFVSAAAVLLGSISSVVFHLKTKAKVQVKSN